MHSILIRYFVSNWEEYFDGWLIIENDHEKIEKKLSDTIYIAHILINLINYYVILRLYIYI